MHFKNLSFSISYSISSVYSLLQSSINCIVLSIYFTIHHWFLSIIYCILSILIYKFVVVCGKKKTMEEMNENGDCNNDCDDEEQLKTLLDGLEIDNENGINSSKDSNTVDDGCEEAKTEPTIAKLIGQLRRNRNASLDDEEACKEIMNTLELLGKRVREEKKKGKEAYDLGGNDVVVDILRSHKEHNGIAAQGCWAMCSLSFESVQSTEQLGQLKSLDLIVEVMKLHANDPKVQKYACWAVNNVVCKNDDNNVFAGQKDIIECVAAAIQKFLDVEEVVDYGVSSLQNLGYVNNFNRNKIYKCGMLPVLKDILLKYPDSEDINMFGCGVIWNLALVETINKECARINMVEIMVNILQRYSSCELVIETASGALSNLLVYPENSTQFHKLEGLKLIIDILDKYAANKTLIRRMGVILSVQGDHVEEIVKYGGIEVVAKVLENTQDEGDENHADDNSLDFFSYLRGLYGNEISKSHIVNGTSDFIANLMEGLDRHMMSAFVREEAIVAIWFLSQNTYIDYQKLPSIQRSLSIAARRCEETQRNWASVALTRLQSGDMFL
eukprot:m.109638 g.109638  ORF g.109638 m.109638 type:complete len:556 (+) comp9204_c1_seq1:2254-3921(+)